MHPWVTKSVLLNYHHERACSLCRRDVMVIIRMSIMLLLHTIYASQTSVPCNAGMWMDVFWIEYRQSSFRHQPLTTPRSVATLTQRTLKCLGLCIPKTFTHVKSTPVAYVNSVFWRLYHSRGSVDDVQRCTLCLFSQLMVINNTNFILSFKLLTSHSKSAFLNNPSLDVTPSLKENFS